MTRYATHTSTRRTPQSEKSDPREVENSAGGFTFQLDRWGRLDRWLILGCEGGSYYASERALTKTNAKTIAECLDADGPRTVERIAEISERGRAPKNDPAVFALALAAAHVDPATRKAALEALPRICRIGTHLFQFVDSVKEFRGWGRGLRRALARWYLEKKIEDLAYQVVKYQRREGFSHRDVLRLCHVSTESGPHDAVLRWAVTGMGGMGNRTVNRTGAGTSTYGRPSEDQIPRLIVAYEEAKREPDPKRLAVLIREHRLTHEMVPNELKTEPVVWEALLETMPLGAMVRNLGRMTSIGLLAPMSAASKKVASALADMEAIRRARLHPLGILVALNTYAGGRGVRGSLGWAPVASVTDALNEAFYMAFDAIEPTGQNILLALDVSGSMTSGTIAGMPGVTPRVGSAAMAMVTARTEKSYQFVGFTSVGGYWGRGDTVLTELPITASQRLDDVISTVSKLPFGGTDCALPMIWAKERSLEVDAFHVYTDNETWAGAIKPHQALREYRNALGRPAKLVVVGMVANDFSIADPDDPGMLDVVGFDTAAPNVIADFTRGSM